MSYREPTQECMEKFLDWHKDSGAVSYEYSPFTPWVSKCFITAHASKKFYIFIFCKCLSFAAQFGKARMKRLR